MLPSRLLPPDALLSSWLIVKSSHQLRCPPLFVAVADHLLPPGALLLRRRCLHCHAAANFIDAPPLPSSLHRRFCLLRRAAVAFIIAPLLIVAPPVALLPLVVIMPPVEVVVHSVALLPLAAVVPCRRAARRRRVPPVAIVVPPIEVCSLYDKKKQRPVEGMPVLMRTGEIGDGARQQYASKLGAQLGLSAGFVA